MKQNIVTKVDYVELRLDADDLELLKGDHSIVMAGGAFRIVKDEGEKRASPAVSFSKDVVVYRGFMLAPPCSDAGLYWIKKSMPSTPYSVDPDLRVGSLAEVAAGIDKAWEEHDKS